MIAIKDFKMPSCCYDCDFSIGIMSTEVDRECTITEKYVNDDDSPDWCPLVDVPDMNVGKCSEFPNNSDCISRRDAVEVADAIWTVTGDKNVAKVWQQLKDLPSAQPEILACGSGELKVQSKADEWCTTCKEYDHEKHICPRFNKVIRETVEETRQENEWTPCSKELPTEDGDYLVTLEKGFAEDCGSELVIIMNFEVDCESFGYWDESFDPHTLGSIGSDWVEIPVTAWKPLSEPYRGE